ncbi:hypothetical protein HPC49_32670 [Pyxidicoccus fallax]|uniref:HEAT repeat domain-containing protein n=1 Tax=Pyxidicoccus fallax TaxID=394095 RepID=A0A848LVL0_9BACT|nr:hypothetical protein [Pyxidicoccus fallax]NMO21671.1 hypothetical protein [Pyxidicoccus fallax]NPC82965.1 hypothetical protein [Pyxidicoccus fallax]
MRAAVVAACLVAGTAVAQRSGPPEQRMPRLTCRAGYLDFEAVHGLEGVRAAIRQALEQNDPAALTFLGERLSEVIGRDVEAALQVVTWAALASEPELSVLLGGLRNSEAVKDPRVAARLFTMAEGHADLEHQGAALVALETQEHFDTAAMDRLATMAKEGTRVPGVRMLAARTLGRVMQNDFQASGTVTPYMTRLLDIARVSTVSDVRRLAVEMGSYPAARLEAETVTELARLMREDPDAAVREMAALVMSNGRDTNAVLQHYAESFRGEKSLCVRAALLRYTLRAGGAEALPQVKEYARLDRRFEQDFADFKALYDAGHTDFDRLWPNKRMRHRCPDESGT